MECERAPGTNSDLQTQTVAKLRELADAKFGDHAGFELRDGRPAHVQTQGEFSLGQVEPPPGVPHKGAYFVEIHVS
jgi:hypothetical protein